MSFDWHDIQASFNIVCTLLGIGSLGMAYTFAQAGPIFGSIGLTLTCLTNVYATVALSRCFLKAPSHILTFSDLGLHVAGKWGRIAVQFGQFGTSLSLPIAFLILGGSLLLPGIFPNVPLAPWHWIILMAVFLLPVSLIKSLKEAYIVMILGAATAIVTDAVAMVDTGLTKPWDNFTPTFVEAKNIFPVFGTYAISYGAALIVPTIQREHPNPSKMPLITVVSLTFITVIYFLIAAIGYGQFGCNASENLLITMTDSGWKTFAYLCMQIHVMIAFAVLLNPSVFYFERVLFNLHQVPALPEKESPAPYRKVDSQISIGGRSVITDVAVGTEEDFQIEYTRSQKLQSIFLRTAVVMVQTFIAILGQSSFGDVVDFIGALTVTMCSILMPIFLYLKMFYKTMGLSEKVLCFSILILCTALGLYTSINRLQNVIEKAEYYGLFDSVKDKPAQKPQSFCAAI